MGWHSHWRVFGTLYLGALLVRLLWAWPVLLHPERAWDPDSYGYHRLALNLLHEHRFSMDYPRPGQPEFFRTPGYPLFLALLYGVLGTGTRRVMGVQVLLSALVPVLAYALFRRRLDEPRARAGAWVLALMPEAALFASLLLSDTLYQALGVGALALLLASRASPVRVAGAFAVLAAATYVRPAGVILVPVFAGWLLGTAPGPWRRRFVLAGLGLLVYGLALAPWLLRNHRLSGRWLLSTAGEMNLVFSDTPFYLAHQQGRPPGAAAQAEHWTRLKQQTGWPEEDFQVLVNDPLRLKTAVHLSLQRLGVGGLAGLLRYRLVSGLVLLFHPGFRHYARVVLGNTPESGTWAWMQAAGGRLARLWHTVQRKFRNTGPGFVVLMMGVYLMELAAFLLAVVGAWGLLRTGRARWLWLALGTYLLLILAAGVNMNPRFRANYLYLLVPLWGEGWHRLRQRRT